MLATGLALKSPLLAAILCACWAGPPRTAAHGRASSRGETARLVRRWAGVVGVLVLVDLAAETPANEADMALASLTALFASLVAGLAIARIRGLVRAIAPARQLVVHGNESLIGGGGLGVAASAHLHRLADDEDPVRAIVHEVNSCDAEEVVILPDARLSADQVRRLGWQLERTGAALRLVTPLMSLTDDRVTVRSLGNRLTLDVRPRRLAGTSALLKGWGERVVALVALVCATPVLLLLVALVRLESPGSPIFRQVRVGKDGRPFSMFKLRSMYVGAELAQKELQTQNQHGDGVLFKMRRDPRVTRVGSLIRRSSLDELPQLVNVIRGEMSLIGPRPGLPAEVARYDETAARRLAVLPGLTGLWQVSGRSDLSWQESVELDVHYVENWRPSLDLAIVARTIRAVVSARGAY